MVLKKLSIPLCDLRLQYKLRHLSGISGVTASEIEMTSDKTHLDLVETEKKIGWKQKRLRNQKPMAPESDSEEEGNYEEKVKVAKRRIVKVLDVNPKDEHVTSEDSSPEEEDNTNEDPDFSLKEEEEKVNIPKVESALHLVSTVKSDVSDYEKMIQKNREEKIAFLQSLKIEEAKSDLSEVIDSVKKRKPQPVKRKFNRKTSPPVLRKSRRLANLSVDFSEDALYLNAVRAAQETEELKKGIHSKIRKKFSDFKRFSLPYIDKVKSESIPPEMTFKEALGSEEFYESYVADVNIQETKSEAKFATYDNFLHYCRIFSKSLFLPWNLYVAYKRNCKPIDVTCIQERTNSHSKFITYNKSDLKKMTVSESNIAKVTPARITALAWYPSSEQLIVTAGDKYGNLGIWNVDSESNPYVMKIHLEGMTNLQFNPFNRIHLVSSSYDGILRCGDMEQQKFFEIYNVSDETCCTYFDVLSATTYLVAQKNGMVALVDRRAKGECSQKKHDCHDYSIKTVNIHPVNRNFFITAENKGPIRLWDLRKLQKTPVADITHHKRCVHSAYFSPVTGNSILATSSDDSVSIFDSTKLTSEIKLKQLMKHDNQTGRWLSVFRATWLPNSEEAFVIGSMQYPRKIEVFDKNLFAYNMMIHENLTTITSLNAFHPMKSALAGGNSSGKVYVFT